MQLVSTGQTQPRDPAVSPEPVTHLSQHRLAQLLLQHAQQLAEANHTATIAFDSHVTSVSTVGFLDRHHHAHHRHGLQQQQQETQVWSKQQGQHLQQQQQSRAVLPGTSSSSMLVDAAAAGADPAHTLDGDAHDYPLCVAVTHHGSSGSRQQQQLVRCSYLVAADGSHSTIRWGCVWRKRGADCARAAPRCRVFWRAAPDAIVLGSQHLTLTYGQRHGVMLCW